MSTTHREKLKEIRTFPSLIKYLRDDMGWPIEGDSFEEITFDYTPEELGIDFKNAVKIEEIKRLRPLSTKQPWGIFFIKFAPGPLPVVALRRILSRVALKKRASANSSERAAWKTDDLLFISNYGEGSERHITFAHFSQDSVKNDLPTLKVLGWDNLDTPLHLDSVSEQLTHTLSWPDDAENIEGWRKTWSSAFLLRHREVIQTSENLSIQLADLARAIRDRITSALAIENESGPLTKLMKAFKEALVHDLDIPGFADMYAQTISYGLLSARISNPEGATADELATQMPVTNPFLKELMETFLQVGGRKKKDGPNIDFDELGVSEVVELLDDANMDAVIRDFGDKNPHEDPVIHFYELFLKKYDAEKRMQRGVFYTPRPVVSYIIRSVDELLKNDFKLPDGLADTTTWGEMSRRNPNLQIPDGIQPTQPFVQILDPATGTGTFLVEVIETIYRTMQGKWEKLGHNSEKRLKLWNEYIPTHLLPRLHGYELLMAPYAIAHLKVGLKLYETGYRFTSNVRARVYLTNTLEAAKDFNDRLKFDVPALAHEADAVNEIKRHRYFTVIIGNPPYSARSYNLTAEARSLIEPYKSIDGKRLVEKGALQLEKNLNDDYVKFLRYTELITDKMPAVVGMITNHSFLENPTLRGMRWSLLQNFQIMELLDLGGNIARKVQTASGAPDENVFDIIQGVAISLFAKPPTLSTARIRCGAFYGTREQKYEWLDSHTSKTAELNVSDPAEELYLFRSEDKEIRGEYGKFISVERFFSINSTGVKTHRDEFCIDFDEKPIRNRINDLLDGTLSDQALRSKYGIPDTHGWSLAECRKRLRLDKKRGEHYSRILYRPFDWRHIYFSSDVIELARMEVSQHFLANRNLGLIFMRQVASDDTYSHFGVTRNPVDNRAFYSNRGTMSFAPLYLYGDSRHELFAGAHAVPQLNIAPTYLRQIEEMLKIKITTETNPAAENSVAGEVLLGYIYAVFHSPTYRKRYADFLKVDFPRFPITPNRALFIDLARFGRELIGLHLMESTKLDHHITKFVGKDNPEIQKIEYSDECIWLDKKHTTGFTGIPKDILDFQFGGYRICEKWLKDRKGRTLNTEEINHFHKIIVIASETLGIMRTIDNLIAKNGGWPGAFK